MRYNLFILVLGFIFAVLFIVGFHEGTHIVFNGFVFERVCFLDCNPSVTGGYVPLGVELGLNPLPYATNEVLAWIGSLIGFIVFCIFFVLIYINKRFFNHFGAKISYGLCELPRKFRTN